MIRILIVDDEPLFRRGIIACVKWAENGITVVGEAQNGREAVAAIARLQPDVVLLDIKMPLMDGIEVIRAVMPERPETNFIMLSCMNEFEYVRSAMKLGARDYLFKPVVCEADILEAIMEIRDRMDRDLDPSLSKDRLESELLIADSNATAVRRVQEYIREHYQQQLTLDDLSQMACLSKNYFCRIFRAETGEPPMSYLTRVRIECANKLFAETGLSIGDVCTRVGYNDYSHFCKTYKKITGMTPGKSRRMG